MSAVVVAVLVGAAACFTVGLIALRVLCARLELVARAEHEVRGPAAALGLACQRMRRDPVARRHAEVLEAQLERLHAGLDDLSAARRAAWGGSARGGGLATDAFARVDLASFVRSAVEPWRTRLRRCSLELPLGAAIAVADRGRLAQALGNLLANSAEHGAGDLRVRARQVPGAIRLEVRNENGSVPRGAPGVGTAAAARTGPAGDRGRGIAIAAQAARDLGGRLLMHREGSATVAVLELPDVRDLRAAAPDPAVRPRVEAPGAAGGAPAPPRMEAPGAAGGAPAPPLVESPGAAGGAPAPPLVEPPLAAGDRRARLASDPAEPDAVA